VDGLSNSCPLADYIAEISESKRFALVDIGVSGGIDRQWRRLGRRLRAIGIDPNSKEVARLAASETNPHVTFVNAFASLPSEHPFAEKLQREARPDRNPWSRLSTSQYLQLVYPAGAQRSDREMQAANLWQSAQLAAPEDSIVVPEYLRHNGITSVDFLKIDVDGRDFELLNSFDESFEDLGILGVGIEVNFWGADSETANSFHNVDRFLKSRGFELFCLTARNYSTRALPSKFAGREPGPTEFGRVLQGDAMYARDLASGLYDESASALPAEKILNLVFIFAAFNLPDCAAETTLKFRSVLSTVCDVDRVLDLLTAQAERTILGGADYRRHLRRFAQRPGSFLRTKNPFIQAAWALKKGYLKWRWRIQLLHLERGSRGGR
jgi:hypothetical protein